MIRTDRGGGVRKPTLRMLWVVSTCAGIALSAGVADDALASGRWHAFVRHCTQTALLQWVACGNEVADGHFEALAKCENLGDRGERWECVVEARAEAQDAKSLCREQRNARKAVCGLVGEGRYDPDFDPDDFRTVFDDANPFLPLQVGNRWQYAGGGETIEVEILDEVKNVEGVPCITRRDVVFEEGVLLEDTDDWIALHEDGDGWYCGEIARNFELFEGDDPPVAELVDVGGSWKAGRDGAKAGVFVPADAPEGLSYRQEWLAGEAEDVATVLSRTYRYGDDPALDAHVPQALADLLCDGDCMVTRDFTPIEPDVDELKYYAPGIGFFLEVKPAEGEVLQITGCNMDARCAVLPEPEGEEE